MDQNFDLQFTFSGKAYKLPVAVQSWGDGSRYAMQVEDIGYLFSPGTNGKFGYVVVPGQRMATGGPNVDLLAAIAKEFEKLINNNGKG
jgi:hypothetical protein